MRVMGVALLKPCRQSVLLAALLIALGACSVVPKPDWFGSDKVHQPTLADLPLAVAGSKNEASVEEAAVEQEIQDAPTQPAVADVIANYRALLATQLDRETKRSIEYRVAALSMRDGSGIESDEAIQLHQQLLNRYAGHSENDALHYRLAMAFVDAGDSSQAQARFQILLDRFPESPYYSESLYRSASLLYQARRYEDSAQQFQSLLADQTAESAMIDHGRYLLAWNQFKLEYYDSALSNFMQLLDSERLQVDKETTVADWYAALADDVLATSALVLAYSGGVDMLQKHLGDLGGRDYDYLLFERLGALYIEQERYADAAAAYHGFIQIHPDSQLSANYHLRMLEAYRSGELFAPLLQAKIDFVKRYGVRSDYFANAGAEPQLRLREAAAPMSEELAQYFHARAQSQKHEWSEGAEDSAMPPEVSDAFAEAADWYLLQMQTQARESSPDLQFVRAEALFEGERFAEAVPVYETIAYRLQASEFSAEAGYSLILCLDALWQVGERSDDKEAKLSEQRIFASRRFGKSFSEDPRAGEALAFALQQLYERENFQAAAEVATWLRNPVYQLNDADRISVLLLDGHSRFALQQYAEAEKAYDDLLALMPAEDALRQSVLERRAAAVFHMAEQLEQENALAAADVYLRVATLLPGSEIAIAAQFDAAAIVLAKGGVERAIALLENFRKQFPKHRLSQSVPSKLLQAYRESEQWSKAASELQGMIRTLGGVNAREGEDRETVRQYLLTAAEYYDLEQQRDKALPLFRQYAHNFPQPLAAQMEAQLKMADYYRQSGEQSKRHFWLRKMIASDAGAGSSRTARSRSLAAESSIELARLAFDKFESVPLRTPLAKSLKRKKSTMADALEAYEHSAEYGIREVTTEAQFYLAEIYSRFSRDLMDSERPANLNALELEQYEILLEEQAYPFEEKAIAGFERLAHLSREGIFDEWVQSGYAELARLLPARYAKQEALGDDFVAIE